MKYKLIGFLKWGTILYIALVIAVAILQRSLIYFPSRRIVSPQQAGLSDYQAIHAKTADGLSLCGWFLPPPTATAPVVIVFHGNAGSVAGAANYFGPTFQAQGVGVLIVGYRGYGGNPGAPIEQGIYADGRSYLAWLKQQGIDPGRWIIFGQSLGTGPAVQMATEFPVRGLILESPFTSLPAVAQHAYPWMPAYWLTIDRYDSLNKIARVHAPLLMYRGSEDRKVPPAMGRRLFDAANQPKEDVLVPGADHNDIFTYPQVKQAIAAFIHSLS